MVCIREVHVAHHHQRFVVVGIESEVLQEQVGAHYTYRVVVEAHPHTIGLTHEEGIFHIDFPIYLGMGGRALDGQFAFAVAFKTYQLVGYETVG